MKTSLPTLTDIRRFTQNHDHDRSLLATLKRHFSPIPAAAMMRHRIPQNAWREGQLDGQHFHSDLTKALREGIYSSRAAPALRASLKELESLGFRISREPLEEMVVSDMRLGLRGKLDLAGEIRGKKAVVEIKTIHHLPVCYPHLEHALQASACFALAWGHKPHSAKHGVFVLYVGSTAPHPARLLPVQMPNRWVDVACDLAAQIRHHGQN